MISVQRHPLPVSILKEELARDQETAFTRLDGQLASYPGKIVVLDDDPTGVQTVHGLSVYTDWHPGTLDLAFAEERSMFFILTNSRSMTAQQTAAVHTELAHNIYAAADRAGLPFLIVSRSDSTLRGHYPLETQVLRKQLEALGHPPFDGEILYPFFLEGGRYTLDDTHYVLEDGQLIPAGQTEFAADRSFGFSSSHLPNWCEEKTGGAILAQDVACITLDDLRAHQGGLALQKLVALHDFGKIVVNSTSYADVAVLCSALLQALDMGRHYIIRGAASVARVLGGIPEQPLLTRERLIQNHCAEGGIVLVGSYVGRTTQQLEALMESDLALLYIEFDVDTVREDSRLEREIARIMEIVQKEIGEGRSVCVYTSREQAHADSGNPDEQLRLSTRISSAITGIIGNLNRRPAFIIAKGGITSYDVGVRALGVRRATVMGQVRPGVPVWMTGPESRFPSMPYVIFPGNVGSSQTLRDVVEMLLD